MTIKELFNCINTDIPAITIYNYDNEVIYSKLSNKPISKFKYFNSIVSWIYKVNFEEIILRIEK